MLALLVRGARPAPGRRRGAARLLVLPLLAAPLASQRIAPEPPLLAEVDRPLPARIESLMSSYRAFADLNGDGAAEALQVRISDSVQTHLQLFANDGTGVLRQRPLSVPTDPVRFLVSGDFSGDGREDFLAIGDQAFFLITWTAVEPDVRRLALGDGVALSSLVRTAGTLDLDGDGDLDLLVSWAPQTLGGGGTRIFRNDGGGASFTLVSGLPATLAQSSFAEPFDRDGDGDGDVAFLTPLLDGVRFATNVGGGRYLLDTSVLVGPPPVGNYYFLRALDLQADGLGDLFLGHFARTATPLGTLLVGLPAGDFDDRSSSLPVNTSPQTRRPLELDAGDFDQDGTVEVLLGLTDSSGVSIRETYVLEHDGAGGLIDVSDAAFAQPPRGGEMLLADADGDGDQDLLHVPDAAGGSSDRWSLFWIDATGTFADSYALFPTPVVGGVPLAVDPEDDGQLELLVAGSSSRGIASRVFVQDDRDRFVEDPSRLVGGLPFAEAVRADFDADGRDDLLAGNLTQLFLDDGSGRYVLDPNGLVGASPYLTNLAAVDLDGDGDVDGLGVGLLFEDLRFLVNDGTGVLVATVGDLPPLGAVAEVAPLEVNGDGLLDLLVIESACCPRTFTAQVLLNQGGLSFVSAPGSLDVFGSDGEGDGIVSDLCVADFDADGRADVYVAVVGEDGPVPDLLWRNDGTGTLVDASSRLAGPPLRSGSVAAGDLDEDGDLDLVVGEGQSNLAASNRTVVLRNDGSGRFSSGPNDSISGAMTARVLADVDQDGDLDLVSEGRMLSNLLRHMAPRATPRIGKPYILDVYGPALGSYVWVISDAPAALDLGLLGRLRIDVTRALDAGLGTFDATGSFARSYLLPNDPTLVGARFYGQALVGHPAAGIANRLTNRVVAEVTAF